VTTETDEWCRPWARTVHNNGPGISRPWPARAGL
jgi:hypothetical protein